MASRTDPAVFNEPDELNLLMAPFDNPSGLSISSAHFWRVLPLLVIGRVHGLDLPTWDSETEVIPGLALGSGGVLHLCCPTHLGRPGMLRAGVGVASIALIGNLQAPRGNSI
jgi:hypothetical protein